MNNSTPLMRNNFQFRLSDHWSFNLFNDPKRLGFIFSRYKFAAKLACKDARVLELGCSIGIGATILTETAINYTGVDLDEKAIITAKENLTESKFTFLHDDFLGKTYGQFDAIVSFDVIEHIHQQYEHQYFETIMKNISNNGICIIGTPNITSAPYASFASQIGHINLYSQERLQLSLNNYFYHVFSFGMNDEILHTGFSSMAHYIFCVGFLRKL